MSDEINTPLQIQNNLASENIKRAVKEALDDQNIAELGKQISSLTQQVTDGFKGSHARQDIANGRTTKVEERVAKIETKDYYNKIIWYLFTAALSGIVGLCSYILYHHS